MKTMPSRFDPVVLRTGVARLLSAGCGKECRSQPLGSALPRSADCFFDFGDFIGAEPHGDKFPQDFASGLLWSANFSSHAKIVSVSRKLCLHENNLCVTSIQVSNEAALSSAQMAGTAVGESELTNSQPVEAGASQRESEMNAETLQAANSGRQIRSLKIERAGDFFSGNIKPLIRISGHWLARAGFKSGHRVEVHLDQPGILTLRFLQQKGEAAL